MLLNGKAETISQPKESTMLEAHPRSAFMDMPSPRVLNSHMYLRLLPRQLKGTLYVSNFQECFL